MKPIDESRFQKGKKAESINFAGSDLPVAAKNAATKPSSTERPFVRTDEMKSEIPRVHAPAFVIQVPEERRITRHPFDLYEDQINALRILKLAESQSAGQRKGRALGELAREALDDYITKKARKLDAVALHRAEAP